MARSFKEFLVESSGLNPEIGSNGYGEYDSYLSEGFKTDAEAIRQLQAREYDYVSKYDLHSRTIKRIMNEGVNINEEFRTDPEAVKRLQAKQEALYDKLRPYYKRIKELESRRDSLMFRMAGVATNLMAFGEKGEKHPEMEATFEKMGKEEDEINKELEKLYPKHDELSDQIERNRKVISKIIVRNAKKAGMDILQYVSQNDLFHKPR